jgi:hypothetical protein
MKYFSHDTDVRSNRKIRKVLRTHGTTGYAIWWALLEELCSADEKGFQLVADDLWLEGLAESLCISDYRTLIRVLDTFAEVKLISPQLWVEHTIYVEAIAERGDAYIKKKAKHAEAQSRYASKLKSNESLIHQQGISDYQNARSDSPYTDTDPDPDPKDITNSLTLTARAEFGEPERLKNEPEPDPGPITPPLADDQITSHWLADPDPVHEERYSAAVSSMIADNLPPRAPWGSGHNQQQSNRNRAQSGAWFKSGLANKRWKDRQDFDKFVAYVETYAENRRKDPTLNPEGTKYGKDYRTAILSRTAATQDENDSMLACWKCWNLEPAAPNYIQSKPEETVVVDDLEALAAFQAKFAKLKADNQARKAAAAAAKTREEELIRGLHESS